MDFLLHGHEFNLKGANRGFFTTRLRANLHRLLDGTSSTIGMRGMGLLVRSPDEFADDVRRRLDRALGVQTITAGRHAPPDPAAIAPIALEMIASQSGPSFALDVKRPDKALALTSYEVAVHVGRYIEEKLGLPVDLHHPARKCTIVLSRQAAIISHVAEPGPGGMPAGTAGRFLALISAGFDSPVAAFRLIRRGGRAMLIHFHGAAPQGQADGRAAVEAMARRLTEYQLHTRLYLCPFEPVQRAIVAAAPSRFRILLYRRMMLRIAQAVAQRIHAHGLIAGDSLAQVASQTALNLEAVDAAATVPVYRPLIGDDKVAIQAEARRIGTFALSLEGGDDCCSAFMPPAPALASAPWELAAAERELDIAALIDAAVAAIETRRYRLTGGRVEDLATGNLLAAHAARDLD